jgi:hypothetical protein
MRRIFVHIETVSLFRRRRRALAGSPRCLEPACAAGGVFRAVVGSVSISGFDPERTLPLAPERAENLRKLP